MSERETSGPDAAIGAAPGAGHGPATDAGLAARPDPGLDVGVDEKSLRLDPEAPLVVTGMARSGSSLACLILNRFAGGLVINDAYAAQLAESLGAPGPDASGSAARSSGGLGPAAACETGPRPTASHPTSPCPTDSHPAAPATGAPTHRPADSDALAAFRVSALARLEERGWSEPGPPRIHRSNRWTPAMRRAAEAARGDDWARLWGAMLVGAAQADGRAFWGWNSAPDHLRAEEILSVFPRARFLFVLREPWAMLRSYRSLPETWGRERARYHPYLQARAWRAAHASRERLSQALPGRVHLLEFEALTGDPEATLSRLARFLGTPPFQADPAALPGNGSPPGPGLTRAEIAAARLGLGPRGRLHPPPPPQGAGLGALLLRSLRAGAFYGAEALRSPDMRGRIRRLARA